jgi:hypothetical protein
MQQSIKTCQPQGAVLVLNHISAREGVRITDYVQGDSKFDNTVITERRVHQTDQLLVVHNAHM